MNFPTMFLWGIAKGVVRCAHAGTLVTGLSLWTGRGGGSWPGSMRDLAVRHD